MRWQSRANACAVPCETPWPEFAAWLAQPVASADKHEQGFSPLSAIRAGKGGRVDAGPGGFVALEYDDAATEPVLQRALEVLAGIDAVVYTSASASALCPRFRIVLRPSRPVTPAEYRAVVEHVGKAIGTSPATESRQSSRLWYRPILYGKHGAPRVWVTTGQAWDVDAAVLACPPPPPRPPRDAPDLGAFPVDERARQAWAALDRRRPEGSFVAALICRDHGLEPDHALAMVLAYARAVGWTSFDGIDERVDHAYEYAREEEPGTALVPTAESHPEVARALLEQSALPDAAPPPAAGFYVQNDSGNADRLLAIFGSNLRFATGVGWLRWEGTRWRPLPGGPWPEAEACARLVREEGERVGGELGDALRQWGIKSGDVKRLRGCMDVAANRPSTLIDIDALDADPWLLNTPTGTLDLRTGLVQPHRREDLITKVTAVPYDPSIPCPRFERFLFECMGGDLELVGYLLRFLGYALTGDVSEHALGVWHGPEGANGKSTLLALLESIMGDYAGSTAPEILLHSAGGSHPTGLMDLRGRRLVTSNEAPEGRRWDESLVKRLTGGDEVKARAMRQDFVAFRPTWKLVLATNARPIVREQGGAFWRRVQLLPWSVSFRGREDRGLAAALAAERPGILARLVSACGEWRFGGGLRPPAPVLEAVEDYRVSQDTIGAFLGDCLERVPVPEGPPIPRTDVYRAYGMWTTDNGEHALPASAFYRVLEERGVRLIKVKGSRMLEAGWRIKSSY